MLDAADPCFRGVDGEQDLKFILQAVTTHYVPQKSQASVISNWQQR